MVELKNREEDETISQEDNNNKVSESEILKVEHDIGVTVRMSWDSHKELKRIAAFEKEKVAVICRRIILEKVQVYQRNPAYKRFLKQLEKVTQ